jgi:signal-transduction protein with cAMP-binding, CBS, and nucleotidyltransferase domain
MFLFLENRPVVLGPDEQKLYDLAFKSLKPREFLKLTSLGKIHEIKEGEKLVIAGQPNAYTSVLIDGKAEVFINSKSVMKLPEGHLMGVLSNLQGKPQSFDIVATTPGRHMQWSIVELQQFLNKWPDLREKFKSLVNQKLVRILTSIEESYVGKEDDDTEQVVKENLTSN